MLRELRRHRVFFAVIVAVLFISFAFDAFGAMDTDSFLLNFKDSEALVSNQIACKGNSYADQLLEKKDPRTGIVSYDCKVKELKPYSSQFGLQGRVYAIGYKIVSMVAHVPAHPYVVVAQLATALLSAVCFGLVALWVRMKFDLFTASVFTAFTAISPMVVGFGRNLYWALPLLILPLVYILFFYEGVSTRKRQLLFWATLGLLLYIRYLCGYEYLTTITIMCVAGVCYFLFLGKAKPRIYIREISIVFAVSVIAFACALGTHVYALQKYTGSTSQAISIVKSRALARTTDSGDYLTYPFTGYRANLNDAYLISDSYLNLSSRSTHPTELSAESVSLLNYAQIPIVNLPVALRQPFATYAQSLTTFILVLVALFVYRKKWVDRRELRQVESLFLGVAIGLAGFFSWMVLAHSHSLVHAHINGILLYLPFALFGYIIVGLYLQSVVTKCMKRRKK